MLNCHPNTVEPWEFISPTPDAGIFEIVGGQVQFFKIEVPTLEAVRYELYLPTQPSIQDFSLRVTLSQKPHGTPIEWHGTPYTAIPPQGFKIEVRDYTIDDEETLEYRTFKVMPGSYYINVQNMANAKATWGLKLINNNSDIPDIHDNIQP